VYWSNQVKKLAIAVTFFAFSAINSIVAEAEDHDASSMWGTAPAGMSGQGTQASAAMHVENGIVAGQVNAAKEGFLFSSGLGDSFQITSIGSQSVISNTIQGDKNNINVTADQESKNTGTVSSNGQISSDR
jgi:hypothetical protein